MFMKYQVCLHVEAVQLRPDCASVFRSLRGFKMDYGIATEPLLKRNIHLK